MGTVTYTVNAHDGRRQTPAARTVTTAYDAAEQITSVTGFGQSAWWHIASRHYIGLWRPPSIMTMCTSSQGAAAHVALVDSAGRGGSFVQERQVP